MWTTTEAAIAAAVLSALSWVLGARHGFRIGVDEGVRQTYAALLEYKLNGTQCECPKCKARRASESPVA